MLEQMGEARAAARIVLRADIVPDLDRDVGAVRVADRIDAQAVGERAASDRRSAATARRLGRARRGAARTGQSGQRRARISNASSSIASRARRLAAPGARRGVKRC